MELDTIREAVARGWCVAPNTSKTMDSDLALAIADQVHSAFLADKTPKLGCATTGELLKELTVRAEVGDYSGYRTVETDAECKERKQG